MGRTSGWLCRRAQLRAGPGDFHGVSSRMHGPDGRSVGAADTHRYRQGARRTRWAVHARPEVAQSRSPAASQPLAVARLRPAGCSLRIDRHWAMKPHENPPDRLLEYCTIDPPPDALRPPLLCLPPAGIDRSEHKLRGPARAYCLSRKSRRPRRSRPAPCRGSRQSALASWTRTPGNETPVRHADFFLSSLTSSKSASTTLSPLPLAPGLPPASPPASGCCGWLA